MAEEIFLQHWIFTRFALPFLLVFALTYAVLEKTKILGENKQLNAIVSFVIGLILVSVAYPQLVITNMILFLSVALIVVFVTMILWGFISGGEAKLPDSKGLKIVVGIVLTVSVLIAVLWATNIHSGLFEFLFRQTWSTELWLNLSFIILIAVGIALVLKGSKSGS